MVTRRQFFSAGAAVPGLHAQAQRLSPPDNATRPPNVLFILADQMTPFMTGPHGNRIAKTPNLDRIAREGVLFENAFGDQHR